MKNIVLYSHGGSGNRGCEAIVRSTRKIIGESCKSSDFFLCSLNKTEDTKANLSGFQGIVQYSNYIKKYSFNHMIALFNNRLFGSTDKYITLGQKSLYRLFNENSVAVSVGGDNYCYSDSTWLHISHKEAKKRKAKTVLWGCSIEEGNLNQDMIEDLKNYDLIVARESITYELLIREGINNNTKLYPDPAFDLEPQEFKLPKGFDSQNTIGINLSPYIFKSKLSKEEIIKIYIEFIGHLLETEVMHIALIPHVFWEHNNDLFILNKIYNHFRNNKRIIMIENELNALQLKYLISKCRIFIGARTHSTIAAYSSCIPTLVLGYSVKSRGIARDLFGTEENMVIPVQEVKSAKDLIHAFDYIRGNEKSIKNHLEKIMPLYKKSARRAGDEVKGILSN
jgi:colanic acid/amylovoran biosynthesis protein